MQLKKHVLKKAPTQLIRFIITGGMATVIHQSTAMASIAWWHASYGSSNALGFLTGTSVAYFINTRWSFKKGVRLKNMVTYWMVALIGLLLSYAIGRMADTMKWPYWVVMALTIGIIPFVSYNCHSRWTYQ